MEGSTKSDEEAELVTDLNWLHRPEEESEDLIKNIEKDIDLNKENIIKNIRTKLLKFLNEVINKKINSEEAKKASVNDFFAYKQELESKKLHDGSRASRMKNFIHGVEYIIFGLLLSPEK